MAEVAAKRVEGTPDLYVWEGLGPGVSGTPLALNGRPCLAVQWEGKGTCVLEATLAEAWGALSPAMPGGVYRLDAAHAVAVRPRVSSGAAGALYLLCGRAT